MTTEEIQRYLHDWYNTKNGKTDEEWPFNVNEVLEILTECGSEVISVNRSSHRWWDEVTYIAKFGDKYFEYVWAEANRDEHVFDLGWDFNWDDVSEVTPYVEMVPVTKWRHI